ARQAPTTRTGCRQATSSGSGCQRGGRRGSRAALPHFTPTSVVSVGAEQAVADPPAGRRQLPCARIRGGLYPTGALTLQDKQGRRILIEDSTVPMSCDQPQPL